MFNYVCTYSLLQNLLPFFSEHVYSNGVEFWKGIYIYFFYPISEIYFVLICVFIQLIVFALFAKNTNEQKHNINFLFSPHFYFLLSD